jgi:hypothetical protein
MFPLNMKIHRYRNYNVSQFNPLHIFTAHFVKPILILPYSSVLNTISKFLEVTILNRHKKFTINFVYPVPAPVSIILLIKDRVNDASNNQNTSTM